MVRVYKSGLENISTILRMANVNLYFANHKKQTFSLHIAYARFLHNHVFFWPCQNLIIQKMIRSDKNQIYRSSYGLKSENQNQQDFRFQNLEKQEFFENVGYDV